MHISKDASQNIALEKTAVGQIQ